MILVGEDCRSWWVDGTYDIPVSLSGKGIPFTRVFPNKTLCTTRLLHDEL